MSAKWLTCFFGPDLDDIPPPIDHGGGGGCGDPTELDPVIVDEIAQHCEEAAPAVVGIDDPDNDGDGLLDGVGVGDGHAPDPPTVDPPPAPLVPPPPGPPPGPWSHLIGPSAAGYVNLDGRAFCRIQRVDGRVWANCYRHAGCRLNVPEVVGEEGSTPTNEAIYEWMMSMEPNSPEMTADARKARAKEHMCRGRALFGRMARR